MPDLIFAVPGSLETLTGGFIYDRRIIEELKKSGLDVSVLNLGEGFPKPTAGVRATATAALTSLPKGVPVIVDGLALGVLPAAAAALSKTNPLIALVHHPLALESGLEDTEKKVLVMSETAALSFARAVIVTSSMTSDVVLADYGVQRERITIAEPGTDKAAFAEGSGDIVVSLLSVGAITPRKNFEALVAALAMIDATSWRLTIVGALDRSPETVTRLRERIAAEGLQKKILLAGSVERTVLEALYDMADAFVSASDYEGYGMAYAEAIARGLPVVGTTGGATVQTVPKAAGLLVAPGDTGALANALEALVADPDMRAGMATAAREGAKDLPTWDASARKIADLVRSLT